MASGRTFVSPVPDAKTLLCNQTDYPTSKETVKRSAVEVHSLMLEEKEVHGPSVIQGVRPAAFLGYCVLTILNFEQRCRRGRRPKVSVCEYISD